MDDHSHLNQYNQFFQYLNTIQPLSEEARTDWTSLFEEKHVLKNEFLIREGDRAHYCYVLVDGVVRVYYSNEGNEYNKTFFTNHTFPTPLTALLSQRPCQLSFQALTNCHLIQFSYTKFRKLFSEHRCLESLLLKILEQEWIKKEIHDIRMVTNDATSNYMIFREEHPGLELRIPQYHIASYLGITPIQLSRIRAQLLQSS